MYTIGTDKSGYATERNLTQLPLEGFRVVRASNLFRLPNFFWFRLTGKIQQHLANLHWMPWGHNCDLYHFFNGISLSNKPWVSTFETYLPRWGAYGDGGIGMGLRRLAHPSCRRLLALSQNAADIQEAYLQDHPGFGEDILPKVEVLHPAQVMLLEDVRDKPKPEQAIELAFVGADFFRKGGLEVLEVVGDLLKKGKPLRLTIVSSLKGGDYASHAGTMELERARKLIGDHPEAIVHHASLPNEEVLQLLRRSHLALLPTWADTYGYFVLEAQAAGCPVVTTNLRALPEINSPETGWMIDLPLDGWRNAVLNLDSDRDKVRKVLREQLQAILEEVCDGPECLDLRAEAALQRIRDRHSPERNARFLEGLYHEILQEKG